MGKHGLKIWFRLITLVTAVALVTSMSAAIAEASPYSSARPTASAVAAAPAESAAASAQLAPCTAPLFGPDKDCESTSPIVDRWVTFAGASESCIYTQHVDWGDGSSSTHTFVDPTPNAVLLIASHAYNPNVHATYVETVTSTVVSGSCEPVPTTTFHFTHLLSAVPSSLNGQSLSGLGISKACQASILKDAGSRAAAFVLIGLFASRTGNVRVIEFLAALGASYLVIEFVKTCVTHPTQLPVLAQAFAYGESHPGKLFKPAGKVPARPQVTGVYAYQKGTLVYFSITYADPGNDAEGFGFVGMNGAGWAEENHPFSKPSYGIVGNHRIDYPFNLACGTAQEFKSYVEAWIYDSHGQRSNPVEIDLSCTT